MTSVASLVIEATPADRAVAMYPKLLQRAFELTGSQESAEDLVQATFLTCVRRPPRAQTDTQLRHWMRRVMQRLNVDSFRRSDEVRFGERVFITGLNGMEA